MKEREVANIELMGLCEELRALVGARLEKFYELGPGEFRLSFRGRDGAVEVACELKKRFGITTQQREAPLAPTNFAMGIRKFLSGARLSSVEQLGFDRVVSFGFHGEGNGMRLVFEMFSNGNLILVDENGKILQCYRREEWKDRKLARGETYVPPSSGKLDPRELTVSQMREFLRGEKPLISLLAKNLNLGALYLEEVCARAGVDLKKPASSLGGNEIDRLHEELEKLLKEKPQPRIYESDYAITPIKKYDGEKTREAGSISEMLEAFLAEKPKETVASERVEKLKRTLQKQKDVCGEYLRRAEESKKAGDLLYVHFERINRTLEGLRELTKKKASDEEIEKFLKSEGAAFRKKEGVVELEIGD